MVEPQAPPVLLLHGLGVSGSVFQAFARRLLPDWAAVAPDLRGHGHSDAPPDGYSPEDYAADLVELIQDSREPPAVPLRELVQDSREPAAASVVQLVEDSREPSGVPVVGHSLGALVGMSLAAMRPELVRWLVLLDPPLDPQRRNAEVRSVYRLRHAAPGQLEAYLLERNPRGGELLAQALARDFRQASDAAFEAMLEGPTYRPVRLSVPTLVLQADTRRGGVLGDAAASAAVHALGDARLLKVAGATHAMHASHPAEVAQAIREFAADVAGG